MNPTPATSSRRTYLFLRGDRLEIYSDSSFEEVVDIQPEDVSTLLFHHFGYVISPKRDFPANGGQVIGR